MKLTEHLQAAIKRGLAARQARLDSKLKAVEQEKALGLSEAREWYEKTLPVSVENLIDLSGADTGCIRIYIPMISTSGLKHQMKLELLREKGHDVIYENGKDYLILRLED